MSGDFPTDQTKGDKAVDASSQASCLFCAQSTTRYWFSKDGSHPIVRCPSCASAYVWPRPDREEIDRYYQSCSYADGGGAVATCPAIDDYYPGATESIRRAIAPISKLARGKAFLDVGAGNGQCALAAVADGFDVSACEPNPNSRAQFRQLLGFDADPDLFDAAYASRHRSAFDVVFLSQVLEHIVEPGEMAGNLHSVLAPGGLAVIGVPHFGSALSRIQGRGDMYITPPEHLNYFSRSGLTALMQRNGFVLERLDTFTVVPRGGKYRLLWPGLYGALRLAEPFGLGMVMMGYFRKA